MLTKATILTNTKQYLGIQTLDTTRDAELTAYITLCIKHVENYCNRDLESASYTADKYIWVDTPLIILPKHLTPCAGVVSAGFEQIDAGMIAVNTTINPLNARYRLIWYYGYAAELSVADGIIMQMVLDFWKRKGVNGLQGLSSKSSNQNNQGVTEQNYLAEIFTTAYREALAPYRVDRLQMGWL